MADATGAPCRLPDAPATPHGERDQDLLRTEIDALFPMLWKTDSSSQLSTLLNIIARAKTMGRPGFDMLKDFAERLRRNRAFDDLYVLTSEMNADGLDTPRTRRLEIQALIELGVFETALDLVRPLLVGSITDPDATKARNVREAYGLLGRIYKQMYVEARKPETTHRAGDAAPVPAAVVQRLHEGVGQDCRRRRRPIRASMRSPSRTWRSWRSWPIRMTPPRRAAAWRRTLSTVRIEANVGRGDTRHLARRQFARRGADRAWPVRRSGTGLCGFCRPSRCRSRSRSAHRCASSRRSGG